MKLDSNGDINIILAYVDDLIFVSSSSDKLKQAVSTFLDKFEGTKEALEWYLGVHIKFTKDHLVISQSAYIERTISEFGFDRCRTFTNPMVSNFYDEIMHHKNDSIIQINDYRTMIGCLQFIARRSRPDIMLAVNILAQ